MAPFTRTPVLETDEQLSSRIGFALEQSSTLGRTRPLVICYSLDTSPTGDPGLLRERIAVLEGLGVEWLTVGFPARTRAGYISELEEFARHLA